MEDDFRAPNSRMRSSWNPTKLLVGPRLTDKKIEQYRKEGWYSAEFREARKEMMDRKRDRINRREGNFVRVEGKLVYSPL